MTDDPKIDVTSTDADNHLPLSIIHARDQVIIDGEVEQDYQFLTYAFASATGTVMARCYLDTFREVSIQTPMVGAEIAPDIMAYLQARFESIQQLGGPEGYTRIWTAPGVTG